MGTKTKVVAVAVMLFASAIVQAEQAVDPAFDRLAKVGVFAFGGIGFAGVTSQGEKDFRVILSRPDALASFEKLLSVENPQAKAYALVGIRRLDLKRFNTLLPSFPDTKGLVKITTMRGCIMSHDPFEAVIKSIAAGDYSGGK